MRSRSWFWMSCLLALGIGAAALPAQAQIRNSRDSLSIREYHSILNDAKLTQEQKFGALDWHIVGIWHGLLVQAEYYKSLGRVPFFCVPDDALNSRDKHMDSIATELRRRPDLWRKDSPKPLAGLMFSALRDQFPCR